MRYTVTITEEPEYQGQHRPPMRDSGSPLHDLTGTYPDDIYGPMGLRYYGTGEPRMDAEAYRLILWARNKPNNPITIYRAIPKDIPKPSPIQPGDWVTIVRAYAVEHGRRFDGGARIQTKIVAPRDLFTNGDSWLEWGYDPQPNVPRQPRTQSA